MSCFSWKCQGIGNAATVLELDVLLSTHISQLVFLCETRQSDRGHRLRNRLGLRGFYGVYCDGMSAGLALFFVMKVSMLISRTLVQDLKSSSSFFGCRSNKP
jgi:hypothetical protein